MTEAESRGTPDPSARPESGTTDAGSTGSTTGDSGSERHRTYTDEVEVSRAIEDLPDSSSIEPKLDEVRKRLNNVLQRHPDEAEQLKRDHAMKFKGEPGNITVEATGSVERKKAKLSDLVKVIAGHSEKTKSDLLRVIPDLTPPETASPPDSPVTTTETTTSTPTEPPVTPPISPTEPAQQQAEGKEGKIKSKWGKTKKWWAESKIGKAVRWVDSRIDIFSDKFILKP